MLIFAPPAIHAITPPMPDGGAPPVFDLAPASPPVVPAQLCAQEAFDLDLAATQLEILVAPTPGSAEVTVAEPIPSQRQAAPNASPPLLIGSQALRPPLQGVHRALSSPAD